MKKLSELPKHTLKLSRCSNDGNVILINTLKAWAIKHIKELRSNAIEVKGSKTNESISCYMCNEHLIIWGSCPCCHIANYLMEMFEIAEDLK